jgi:hypothetical protein
MRSNQAAVQRRVNGARSNGVPPPTPSQNGYAPYPPTPSGYNNSMPSNTPPPPHPQEMPSKLNAQQQLQFILNALGDRIAKLEIGHQTITQTLGVSIPLNSTVPSQSTKNYDQEIGQIQQNMNHLNQSIERLSKNMEQINEQLRTHQQQQQQHQPFQNTSSSSVSDNNTINQEQLISNIDTLSSELDTRTEILTTEINKTKDLVLQLQSTVIHVFHTQFAKTSQQDLENGNTNAQEEEDQDQEDLPSSEYNHPDSNYLNLDSKAFFEYNVLPEALDEHTNNDYDENEDEEDDGDDNK